MIHTVCTGPITYRGQAAVQTDIANFKAALAGHRVEEAFIPAVAPGTIELQRANHYYETVQEFLYATADAMKTEYRMIVDAGFILQIDNPRMVTEWDSTDPPPTAEEYRRFATVRIEALNHALAGLPEDRVRYHMCWGSWHGPHTTDAPLTSGRTASSRRARSSFRASSRTRRIASSTRNWGPSGSYATRASWGGRTSSPASTADSPRASRRRACIRASFGRSSACSRRGRGWRASGSGRDTAMSPYVGRPLKRSRTDPRNESGRHRGQRVRAAPAMSRSPILRS